MYSILIQILNNKKGDLDIHQSHTLYITSSHIFYSVNNYLHSFIHNR